MKKKYIKPLVLTVELKMRTTFLNASIDPEGMYNELITEETVEIGF